MTESTASQSPHTSRIEFFFDPACPWTWATSRWLVDAAGRRGIDIEWRNLALWVINAGRDVPERYRAPMEVSALAHRVLAAVRDKGDNELVGAVYTEYGRRVHHDLATPTADLVRDVVVAAGAAAYEGAIDDAGWDDVVTASTNEPWRWPGPTSARRSSCSAHRGGGSPDRSSRRRPSVRTRRGCPTLCSRSVRCRASTRSSAVVRAHPNRGRAPDPHPRPRSAGATACASLAM